MRPISNTSSIKARLQAALASAGMATAFFAAMAGFVAILPLAITHPSYAASADEALPQVGATVYAQSGCAGCHASGVGPALKGVGQRLNETQLRKVLTTRGAVMPSYSALADAPAAGVAGHSQLDALVAYLQKQ